MARQQLGNGPHPGIVQVARRVWNEAGAEDVSGLAAKVAFYFSLALFPFFIFLAGLAGTLPFTDLWQHVLAWIVTYLPRGTRVFIFDTISGLTRGHTRFLSFGLLGTLWAASAGLMSLTDCLNIAYGVKETRSYWRRLGIALTLTVILAVVMVGSFALLTANAWVGKWIGDHAQLISSWHPVWYLGRWVISLILLDVAIAVVDNVLPNLHRRWQWLSPGTVFVVVTWIPATVGFNFYVQHVTTYNKTYGTLGAFVILMVWIYISSLLTLVGATLNREIGNGQSELNQPHDAARPVSPRIKLRGAR